MTKGLQPNKDAFEYGIRDLFFGKYSSIVNTKHAEMVKFASKHYKPNAYGLVSIIDEPRRELEMLFSMTDYLGFKYVGLEK